MSYIRNVKVETNNRLDLSGSAISITGSLFGSAISGTTAEFTSLSASLVRINDAYSLPISDGSTGQVLKTNGAGVLTFADESGGGSSVAAGPDTSIQFNKVGDLSGSSNLTYNYSTGILSGTISQFTGISSSYLALSSSTTPSQRAGTIFYDNSNGLMRQWTEVTDVDIHLGQQTVLRVKNDSGAVLAKGKIVHLTGSTNSDTPLVTTASYESDSVSADTLGVVMAEIGVNATGYILLNGILTGPHLDLSSYAAGDMLYLSSSGDFSNVVPVSPLHEVRIGQVTRATSNGAMFVRIQNGYEIDELHDVLISSKTEGDLLAWDNSTGVWKNTKSLTGSYSINGDITASNAEFTNVVADKITAREYHTEIVSASIVYQDGSTKFGDSVGDTHQFSGSILLSGSQTVTGDITVNTLKSSTSEVNLYTAFPSDNINIGRASAGTSTTIKSNNVIIDRDLAVNGGDFTTTATTFNLLNTAGTLNVGTSAGTIAIGTSATGNVTIGASTKNVIVPGNFLSYGNVTLGNSSTDVTSVAGTLAVNGALISTNDSTFTLLNTTATTINFGGAAVNMNIGATTGQTTIKNRLIVNGSTTGDSTIAGNLNVDSNTLYVDATSNEVGIGKNNPNAKLDVNGSAIVSGTLTVTQGITADSFTGSLAGTATQVSETLTRGAYLTGDDYDGSAATTWAVDATSANTASKVVARDASGNFSAGTITATLDGNASTATTLQTSRTINGVSFNGSSNITVEPYIEDDESTNATRNLIFTDNTTAGFKRLNEDSSFVYNPYYLTLGIGTSTPNYGSTGKPRIHLFGSSVNTADFFNAKILIEDNTDTYIQLLSSTTGKSGLIFGDSNSSAISRIEYDHAQDSFTHNIVSNFGEHYFQINSGNELIVKDNLVSVENNLAVGKSTANETLDVNGNGLISGSLTVTGTVTELSTRRIKKNIRSMKPQLETVSKLNPVTYFRRDTEEKTKEYGFISEEVKQVYPEFVNGDGVNYSKMVSILVSAVKELKDIVEEQREEIKVLKKKIK